MYPMTMVFVMAFAAWVGIGFGMMQNDSFFSLASFGVAFAIACYARKTYLEESNAN